MPDIPELAIPPDEADREMLRELIFEAEAAGDPARVYPAVRDALYDSWAAIDALRAAQGAGEAKKEEPCTR